MTNQQQGNDKSTNVGQQQRGDKEVAANQLAVRTRGGKDLGAMSVETFVERLQVELSSHGRKTLED